MRLKEKLEDLSNNTKIDNLDEKLLINKDKAYLKIITAFTEDFEKAMDDDFNTPLAVSVIFEFVNRSNKYFEENSDIDSKLCAYALSVLTKLGNILTLFQPVLIESKDDKVLFEKLQKLALRYKKDVKEKNIENLIDLLLKVRENARNKKDWATSDTIRKELDQVGFEIQDTPKGPVWRKK